MSYNLFGPDLSQYGDDTQHNQFLVHEAGQIWAAVSGDAGRSHWDASDLEKGAVHPQTKKLLNAIRRDSAGEVRMDAPSGGYNPVDTTYYDPDPIEEIFGPETYADDSVIPEDFLNSPGATSCEKRRVTYFGRWRLAGTTNTNVPKASVGTEPVTYGLKSIEERISWSIQDLDALETARSYNRTGQYIDLIREKYNAIERTYSLTINDINAKGLPGSNIYGVHNHYATPRITSPYALGANQTPEANLAVLNMALAEQQAISRQSGNMDCVFMPDQLLRELSNQLIGTSGKTTLQLFKESTTIKNFFKTPEVEEVGPGGTPILHFFKKGTIKSLTAKRMTRHPVVYTGKEYSVYHDAKIGGCHSDHPFYQMIVEGVLA